MARSITLPSVRLQWKARKKGRYAVARWTEDGKPRCKALGYLSEAEAEAEVLRIQVRLHHARVFGSHASPSSQATWTVEALVTAYVEHWLPAEGASENMQITDGGMRAARLIAELGGLPLSELTVSHLRTYVRRWVGVEYRSGSPYKSRTILDDLRALKRAWDRAQQRGLVFRPFPSLRGAHKWVPNDARPERRLTSAEVAALVETTRTQPHPEHVGRGLHTYLAFVAWSGWRPIAVSELRVEDCWKLLEDAPREQQQLWCRRDKHGVGRGWRPVTEGARRALLARLDEIEQAPDLCRAALMAARPTNSRDVRKAREALARAEAQAQDDARVWQTPRGTPVTPPSVSRWLKRYAPLAGVEDVQLYDLRRHACTEIVAGLNGDLESARRFTGHRTAQNLQRYLFARPGVAEAAAGNIGWQAPKPAEEG